MFHNNEIGTAAMFMADTAEVLTIWIWAEPNYEMADDGSMECDVTWYAEVAASEDISISYGKDWVL